MDSITQPHHRIKDCETSEVSDFKIMPEDCKLFLMPGHMVAEEEKRVEASGREEAEIVVETNNGSSPDVSNKITIDPSEDHASRISIPECCILFSRVTSRPPRTRLYQVWPGKNVFFFRGCMVFFFRGRMVCGPDPRGFLLTAVSIVFSNWIFCSYSGDSPSNYSAFLVILSNVLTVIVFVCLILAGTRDPGIVSRNNKLPIEEISTINGTRSRRVSIDGVEMKLKYCRICRILRPPRSCHCTVCDNCVEKFDHHCPWIGQCIGLRNYRYYMMFILSAFVFFVYVFAFSWWRIRRKLSEAHSGVFRVVMDVPETFALVVFSLFAIWFLGGLAIFHVYLITKNQTARENFKQRYAKSPNPYDQGILGNVKEALFRRLPPSKLNFRSVVAEPMCDPVARIPPDTAEVDEEDTIVALHASRQIVESLEKSSEDKVELER